MGQIADFVSESRRQLAPVLNRSGNILYSSIDTLRPGAIYLLGLNPGGDSRRLSWQTVGKSLANLPSLRENQYIDLSWNHRPPGESKLQRRVRALLESLGSDPREVCCSNLIFVRSRNANTCGYPDLAETCWPVHVAILKIVRPRLIVCFGNSATSPYAFLCSKLSIAREITFDSGHGEWKCRAFSSGQMWVVGLPHLSRYAVDRHPRVLGRLRRLLSNSRAA